MWLPDILRRAPRQLIDLVYPRNCVACAAPVGDGPWESLCPDCVRELTLVRDPCCRTCGYPWHGLATDPRSCLHCEQLDPLFEEGRTAVLMRGPARALVHGLKYHHGLHLHGDIVRIFRQREGLRAYLEGGLLQPVPLHPRKRRERGYNQSEIVARAVQSAFPELDLPIVDCLRRTTDTQTQTRLDRAARRRNLLKAFDCVRERLPTPGERIVLVDDVFTTGATLNACSAPLRHAGFDDLRVLTFGHG